MDAPTDETDDGTPPREQIATGAALVTMGLLAAVLMAADVSWWWIAFPIGGGLVPLAVGVARALDGDGDGDGTASAEGRATASADGEREDALAVLRDRYARGEIDEETFERRVEDLLATEDLETASGFVGSEREAEATDDRRQRESERA